MTVPAEGATGRLIAELATELARVFARCASLEEEIEEAFLSHRFGEILATMPGIGLRAGARILAEIGDGSGFASGAKLKVRTASAASVSTGPPSRTAATNASSW